jgi:hypothetical protein
MSVWQAWVDGWRRVQRAPAILASAWLLTLAVALSMAVALHDEIAAHLGSSLAADQAASGVDYDWWNEFLAQASELGRTFVPAIIGGAAVLGNLSTVADRQALPLVISAAVVIYLALTVFLTGGVLDRLARDRAVGTFGFFAACGGNLFRLLRLMIIAGAAYAAAFGWLHPWLFDSLYTRLTHDVAVERTAFLARIGLYAVFGLLLLLINLIVDYAKIRMIVEDRRSAIGAVAAALRFIRRHLASALGLYLLNMAGVLVLLGLYVALAPGSPGGGLASVVPVAAAQAYLVLRLATRLVFASSQIALFQSRLAHAGYTAAPLRTWPDSPAAEAVRPE